MIIPAPLCPALNFTLVKHVLGQFSFQYIDCTFLRDECRSMKLISVGGLAEAVTAFISILTSCHDNLPNASLTFLDWFTLRIAFTNRRNSYTTKYFTAYEGSLSITAGKAFCPQSLN